MPYYIKNTEWEQIILVLLRIKGLHKNNLESLRLFMEAICYVLRNSCQWRMLPSYYGNWHAVHSRFRGWCIRGIWQRLFEDLQISPDYEHLMIDGSIVRAHACAAGYGDQAQQALGRSRGGFSTKIHALVDALGNPLKFILTPGQSHEITQAENLLENINQSKVIADKAYDSDILIKYIEDKGGTAIIPSTTRRKSTRARDKTIYKERHLIECFFSKIKHFRRIFSRFDKAASTYMAFLHFVGVLIWTR